MIANQADTAYQHLRDAILDGELQPGARVSSLAVARELGSSNMPVREALTRLEGEGLLERIPYAGHVVRAPEAAETRQLHELRALLEGFAGELAAERGESAALGRLDDLVDSMQALGKDRTIDDRERQRRMRGLDIAFHRALFAATGNAWLRRIGDELGLLTEVFRGSKRHSINQRLATATARKHRDLVAVLRTGKSKQAGRACRDHQRPIEEY